MSYPWSKDGGGLIVGEVQDYTHLIRLGRAIGADKPQYSLCLGTHLDRLNLMSGKEGVGRRTKS